MERFCEHIEKLLAQHEFVVVPNLGGFVVQHQTAQIFSDRIKAPLDTIGFNPLMLHADGLLAIEIARIRQISYRLAMEYIDKEVESIKFKLNTSGNVRLANLGTLQKNASGNLLFQPSEISGFLPQNLGLTDLYVSERNENSGEEAKKITFTLPSARTFRYAASILLILGLFAVTNRVSDVKRSDSADLSTLSFVNSPKTTIQPVIPPAIDSTKLASTELQLPDSFRYHVIVASLPTQRSADKFCNSLVAEQFTTAHVLPPVKTYRVAIQSFSDKQEAIRYMENLRLTDHQFETAWVLCK